MISLYSTFDSREIIERIETLESELFLEPDEIEELRQLKELESEANSLDDWKYGVAFISEDYFDSYAEELANDIGSQNLADWPYRHIDWHSAAKELKEDYTLFEAFGRTFYAR